MPFKPSHNLLVLGKIIHVRERTPNDPRQSSAAHVRPLLLFVLLSFQLTQAGSFFRAPVSQTSVCPISTITPETHFTSSPRGLRFNDLDRARAVARGLNYIYRTSLDRRNFAKYSGDYLWCFYTLS